MRTGPNTRFWQDAVVPRAALAVAACLALAIAALQALDAHNEHAAPALADGPAGELNRILGQVAGPANIQASLNRRADGSSALLVLVDERTAGRLPQTVISDLVMASGIVDEAAGDTISYRQMAFVRGRAWMETASLAAIGLPGLLAAWLGWLALAARPTPTAIGETKLRGRLDDTHLPMSDHSPSHVAVPVQVRHRALTDPARAAGVIRNWLAGEGRTS